MEAIRLIMGALGLTRTCGRWEVTEADGRQNRKNRLSLSGGRSLYRHLILSLDIHASTVGRS